MSTSATSVTESPEKSRVKSPNSTLAFCEMHGNSYIRVHGIHLYPYGEIHNVQQLLPRKSLSCKLVGKRSGLSLEAFLKDHYLSGSPVVIRDSMDQWPAKNKWNGMNYLRKVAGFRTVPIEMKECIQNKQPRTVRMYYRLAPGPASYLFRHSVTSLDSSWMSPLHFRDLHSVAQVKKLEIGALVFISGVVRVKILKFEQARTRHGNSRTWLLGWMSPYTFEIFTLLRRREPDMVQKLEIGALVFISGVVRVKILKFEQARTRHGNSRTWLLGWMSPYTFEIFTLLRRLVLFLIMIYWLWTLDSVSGTDGADANMLKSSS
ncbi:hypothetical protein T459_21421 [Capsicum annuum]|uniref:Uncharacterized protein n=1 Tax=Capsicum annuum TaxID=4072 RepID=A0A2G2YWN5_CAPAN|nr:hypothetical protein T459_21421 [Capsicum annuum]